MPSAAPAAAEELEIVAMVPHSYPRFDVAHGPDFAVVVRNSNAFSFAEQWVVRRNSDGTLRFDNRLQNAAGQMVSLDTQPPREAVGPHDRGGAAGQQHS